MMAGRKDAIHGWANTSRHGESRLVARFLHRLLIMRGLYDMQGGGATPFGRPNPYGGGATPFGNGAYGGASAYSAPQVPGIGELTFAFAGRCSV